MKTLMKLWMILPLALIMLGAGCSDTETPTEAIPDIGLVDSLGAGETQSLGAYTSIAWPLGPNENPNDWIGDEDDRTRGGTIYACNGWINSHSGADYYARDLSRRSGSTAGRNVYAGFSGRVVKAAWTDCYGNCVVIYDHSRRVAVRYAHLQSIAVTENQWVNIRQYIGQVGNTGCGAFNPHLHLVVYENIDHFINRHGNPNWPIVPIVCDSNYYACRVYFFC